MTQNTFKPRMQLNSDMWSSQPTPKRNGRRNNQFSNNSFQNRRQSSSIPKKIDPSFDLDADFPSMSNNSTTVQCNTMLEYKNKILLDDVEEETDEETLPYGWVSFQGNKGIRNIDVNENMNVSSDNNDDNEEYSCEVTIKTVDSLCKIYNDWVSNYIESWGEEEYEKLYTFPNHDIHYFDKLDELEDLQNEERSLSDDFDSDEEAWNRIYRY